jgi:hypothetical protein
MRRALSDLFLVAAPPLIKSPFHREPFLCWAHKADLFLNWSPDIDHQIDRAEVTAREFADRKLSYLGGEPEGWPTAKYIRFCNPMLENCLKELATGDTALQTALYRSIVENSISRPSGDANNRTFVTDCIRRPVIPNDIYHLHPRAKVFGAYPTGAIPPLTSAGELLAPDPEMPIAGFVQYGEFRYEFSYVE